MKFRQFGQTIRDEGPESHKKKKGTPTFGGVFILGSAFLACLLCGNFSSAPFLIALFVTVSYFFLGGLDDYLKILKKNTKGVSARQKLLWQFSTALLASFIMIKLGVTDTKLYFPSIKEHVLDLGWWFEPK
jgi:phospho-N-acetylmuramoyl-pentapeptide-transferase